MEDKSGQNMLVLSQTAWANTKRSANPLDANYQLSKRPAAYTIRTQDFDSFTGQTADQEYASHSPNAGYGWKPRGIGWDLYESSPNGDGSLTEAGDQHDPALAGPRVETVPMPQLPQASAPWETPPLQSSATDTTGSCLSSPPATQSSPLGPAPASAPDHTASHTPSGPVISSFDDLDAPSYKSYMHGGLASNVYPPNQLAAPYHNASHAHQESPADPQSSTPPVYAHWQAISLSIDMSPTSSSLFPHGSLADFPQSALSSSIFEGFYNSSYNTSDFNSFSHGVMDYDNTYVAPTDPARHDFSSTQSLDEDLDMPPTHEALPIRGTAVPRLYEGQTQLDGGYVSVINFSGGQDNTQDTHTSNSDVDDTMRVEDDKANIKLESVHGLASSSEDSQSSGSESRKSSWVHVPSPDGAPQVMLSTNNLIHTFTGTSEFFLVSENPGQGPRDDKPPRKRRRQFDSKSLEETNRTRMLKACVACRKQKIKCVVNDDDPAAPCDRCRRRRISSSGKIIHRTVCHRTYTVSSIRIIRQGGLGFTLRWEGTKMVDVVDEAGNSAPKTIRTLQGLSKTPNEFEVRRFIPREGDVTHKQWTGSDGRPRYLDLPPYCVHDIQKAAETFSKYLGKTALEGLEHATSTSATPPLIRETYRMICKHHARLDENVRKGRQTEQLTKELHFFQAVVKLVWCMRHTTGSVWLHGDEKLGTHIPDEEGYPLINTWTYEREAYLPRMIVAQFDSIQNERILPNLLKKVLEEMERSLSSCKDDWFTMYLAVFILLHEISIASRDRYRWAREHQQKKRYGAGKYASLGLYVENFQKASYPLLAYWHYYKCDELDEVNWAAIGKTKQLKDLEPYQAEFMEWSTRMMRDEARSIPPAPDCWEHELFFVSHMFKRNWNLGYQTFNFMDE